MEQLLKNNGAVYLKFDNPETIFTTGLKHYENGDFALAEEFLLKAQESGWNPGEVESMLGHVYLAQGQIEQSEAVFREALSESPDNVSAKIGLGELYMRIEEPFKAEDCFRSALELESNNGSAWSKLGTLYQSRGKPERAKFYYKCGTDCGSREARFNLGAILLDEDMLEEAKGVFEPLLDSYEYRAEATLNMGYILMKEGKFDDSLEMLNKAEKLMNSTMKANYREGLEHYNHGRYRQAVDRFEKALKINPDYFPAKNALQTAKSRIYITEMTGYEFNEGSFTLSGTLKAPKQIRNREEPETAEDFWGDSNMVSIIITASKGGAKLERCINRCLLLSYPKYEIIVLPDRSIERRRRGVRIIPTGRVDGSIKRNMGARLANGNILAFIEPEAHPDRNWLNEAVESLMDNETSATGREKPFRSLLVRKEEFPAVAKFTVGCESLRKLFLRSIRSLRKSDFYSVLLSPIFLLSSILPLHPLSERLTLFIEKDNDVFLAKIRLQRHKKPIEREIDQPMIQPMLGDVGASYQ